MAKEKDCWNWIQNQFQQKEKIFKKPNRIKLEFFVFKDSTVSYYIGVHPNQDYPVKFKAYQILACIEKATESGMDYSVEEQFDDNPVMIIRFSKKI